MATKYPLFFGLLLIALCLIKGFGHRAVELEPLPVDELSVVELTDFGAVAVELKDMEPVAGERAQQQQQQQQQQRQQRAASPPIRQTIVQLASAELGVREATGNNDGPRVEEYLRYTNLGKGYAWCAAFVSWVYGQAGLAEPRSPWSPALFPNARSYCQGGGCDKAAVAERVQPADLFGIYGAAARRINHVGLVKERQGRYLVTVEGNSSNRVESRRRHLKTVYALANWLDHK